MSEALFTYPTIQLTEFKSSTCLLPQPKDVRTHVRLYVRTYTAFFTRREPGEDYLVVFSSLASLVSGGCC